MTAASNFTPGRWVAEVRDYDGTPDVRYQVRADSGVRIAVTCRMYGAPDYARKANAELIAAAPDLYKALAYLVAKIEDGEQHCIAVVMARAALAKVST